MMDDGEVDSPDSGGLRGLQSSDYSHFLDDSSIIQSDWDNLMRTTQVCSHKHICNPTTGPDNTHTHTCEHTHTHTIASGDEEKLTKKKRPSGNKEAVRKYREKQKAVKVNLEVRNAELEKENSKIPELLKENLRLRRKLLEQVPTQAALDQSNAENKRLKTLLLHLRRLIDSELDSTSLQKHPLNLATRVDGCASGQAHLPPGNYYSSVVPCAAPLPCYPARPASQTGVTDLDRMASVGWHTECEHVNTVCHDPESEAHVVSAQCTPFHAEGSTKAACNASVSNHKSNVVGFVKGARRRSNSSHPIPIAYHAGGVPCAAPVPCFNGLKAVNQPELIQQQRVENLSWEGGCEIMTDMCQDTEMTADSSPHCTALSPEEVTQSASTVSRKEPALTSSKLRAEGDSPEEQMFPPGGYFPEGPQCGGLPPCFGSTPGSQTFSDSWFEDCDFINGVCQAHTGGAQSSQAVGSFRPEDATHSTRSALPTVSEPICQK
ncbi:protein MpBZIP13 [Marchantia polymorpha subsp. ruderalis]|uniref:BZIP domain-containing protein n=1 Tax=Marchantia polymorpha TaxID=3197 RepID=A0A2R6W9R2_MARPO|nr:hypothetical protein MARPO_0122s0020 [Marchantia polymorpha]PTQ30589.1 hypothetical protein MARPO_0122s0020 [Marchantia polymorpha]BBN02580.1 hypothetical protein Mp_2g16440 [Marchantia polymorpha subsp. ruderalis]BBN02581.1 hypothetical protein Mp_2g16440 [Marchantia polymorpha subsp. ruderalis]|eukprot:PTQ30588.1 hypothetical protein MARPO_0122s0020 [Marchantia polymorpha]